MMYPVSFLYPNLGTGGGERQETVGRSYLQSGRHRPQPVMVPSEALAVTHQGWYTSTEVHFL